MFADVKDMTPARFDVLYWIHEKYPRHLLLTPDMRYEVAQYQLTEALGLARQTIWKMVRRLAELGLVTVRKDPMFDERLNIIRLTDEGLRRIRQAMGVAFTEQTPRPRDAPADGPIPRYWRRPELADVVIDERGASAPKKVGREVAKIFTAFAHQQIPGGRRGKRERQLELLDRMIGYAKQIARALGNTTESIYRLEYEPDH